MSEASIHFGVCGAALMRAADAMLRSLGGAEVRILFPAFNLPGDSSAQLGLVDPGVEEVCLTPVVVRSLATESTGPRRRLEFLVPAADIAAEIENRNVASATALFDSALGVVHDNEVFHIEGALTEYFAGSAYLYRVVAVD